MRPSIILHHTTKSIFVAYSERELTCEVNLPTNLGELTFKNTPKWVIDQFGVVRPPEPFTGQTPWSKRLGVVFFETVTEARSR